MLVPPKPTPIFTSPPRIDSQRLQMISTDGHMLAVAKLDPRRLNNIYNIQRWRDGQPAGRVTLPLNPFIDSQSLDNSGRIWFFSPVQLIAIDGAHVA